MKLSARNQLKGKIVAVTKGQTTAHVRIDIGGGNIITSSITNEVVDDLALEVGDDAFAVIKGIGCDGRQVRSKSAQEQRQQRNPFYAAPAYDRPLASSCRQNAAETPRQEFGGEQRQHRNRNRYQCQA
jgi:molybdopterin-binding protein